MNTSPSDKKKEAIQQHRNHRRRLVQYVMNHPAPAEAVFPLLCPVREYDWLEGWSCDLIYTDSGVAELDCVFISPFTAPTGQEVWACTRYRQNQEIAYVRMGSDFVVKLTIRCEDNGDGTSTSRWQELYTTLSAQGNTYLEEMDPDKEYQALELMLNGYIRSSCG